MKLLAIDTSGRRGSVALAQPTAAGFSLMGEVSLPKTPRTAQTLLPEVKRLLAEAGWRPGELNAVAVAAGPGSFTGLRLGIVTAKTLAYATGAALVAVPTLPALAWSRGAGQRPVWSALDAQRDEVFATRFTAEPQPGGEEGVLLLSVDQWCAKLSPGEAIASPAAAKWADQLPAGVEVLSDIDDGPPASAVAQFGAAMLAAGLAVDPLQLVPQYHRRSAAEEKSARNGD